MFVRKYIDELNIDEYIVDKYNMKEVVYFDIETTGFDKEENRVILISFGQYTGEKKFGVTQYFAETLEDEGLILEEFVRVLHPFKTWCSYNGLAFDEPFIKRRMEKNNIAVPLPEHHIDLYRRVRPFYKQLGMERCNLKTVEKFLGIYRKDQIDGEKTVQLYNEYLNTGGENTKEILMLHNYEDVVNLPQIFKLVYRIEADQRLIREDPITSKQQHFLKLLLKKSNLSIEINLEKMSKKAASRLIETLVKGRYEVDSIIKIINNDY